MLLLTRFCKVIWYKNWSKCESLFCGKDNRDEKLLKENLLEDVTESLLWAFGREDFWKLSREKMRLNSM
jgi:hypothetical protein